MNILFVFYVPSGGVETLNRQRSSALKKANMNAHFLYYKKERDLVNDHGAPVYITNEDHEISGILSTGNYSAVVITSDYLALQRFRNLGYTGKMILEIQGYGPKETARTEMTKAVPYVTGYGNGLLNPRTPHIEQIFQELYPSTPKFSYNNCFDTAAFAYAPLPKNQNPIIGWTGRIEDNKNWREFLLIGHYLITLHNPNIKLYMFEDPTLSTAEERAQFQQQIQALGLQGSLTIHQNIPNENMKNFFSEIGDSGGFLCSTSKVEGAPYAVLEAMTCRCPVLTTDSDGVRSSVIHNQTGKYYQLGNIQNALEEAKDLMDNSVLRESIRNGALQHVKTNFSPELYASNFAAMLQSLGV
ncbi:glycosyltransferase [Metabacillus sp. GX 13764]|uniref:glycosyltransferase family 4 protein n=1 Tax=Metabacillus kandeliae TaxID=2900151 RepID=UPI001E357BB7|nr:glycosyltransferase [Metabacillus kandeliae]MCD7032638.1 glycosyltransferase [Metabacillus kandeliae]